MLQTTSRAMPRSSIPLLLALACLAECIDLGHAIETVRLTPPIIKPMSQMDQVACYRPVRSVIPRIEIETAQSKY